jgi:hypothetical protein
LAKKLEVGGIPMIITAVVKTQLLAASTWLLADPRRLSFYLMMVAMIATLTVMAAAPLVASNPIYLAPNPGGGSGGSG